MSPLQHLPSISKLLASGNHQKDRGVNQTFTSISSPIHIRPQPSSELTRVFETLEVHFGKRSASFDSNAVRLRAGSGLSTIGQWPHHAAGRELRHCVDSSDWASFDADGCTWFYRSSPFHWIARGRQCRCGRGGQHSVESRWENLACSYQRLEQRQQAFRRHIYHVPDT